MGHRPEVTAVVVNWNAGEHLVRCVQSLLAQADGVDLDIVVVDNDSSDGSLAGLKRFSDAVRVVQTGENLGFGAGVNRGLGACEGTYVAVLNPDVVLAPQALGRMVSFLEAQEGAGLVGPRLVDPAGGTERSCGRAPTLVHEICRRFLLHLVFPFLRLRQVRPRNVEAVAWVTGACFVARRAALADTGGMDETFFMYYEDVDLGLRLGRRGWDIYYLPEAEGRHAGAASSRKALERMLIASEASYQHFVEKHFGGNAALLLSVLAPVEMGLRIPLWCAVWVVCPGRRREARARLRAYWRMLRRGAGHSAQSPPPGGWKASKGAR